MLIQSHEKVISILPALPAAWKSGSFRGFRARGGFVFDASWQDGAITSLSVRSTLGKKLSVRFGEKLIEMDTVAGQAYQLL